MAPGEAVLERGVRVRRTVGVGMVVAVVRGPPQRAALHGGGAQQREHELHGARSAEGAVREIAVVERGHREHAQAEQGCGKRRQFHARADP